MVEIPLELPKKNYKNLFKTNKNRNIDLLITKVLISKDVKLKIKIK